MPQVKKGGAKPYSIKNTTISGLNFAAKLYGNAVDVPIVNTDFVPEKIQITAVLKREGKDDVQMIATNMLILGIYSTLQKNQNEFLEGLDLINSTSTKKAVKLRFFKYNFNSPLQLKGNDELIVTVTVPEQTAFSSAIDTNDTYIDFKETPTIGYETGVSILNVETVEANSVSANVTLGEDVVDIAILNLDKTSFEPQVISSASIQSAYYDRSFNFHELVMQDANYYPDGANYRWGSVIPMADGSNTGRVYPWLSPLPQCFYLHKGKVRETLLNAKLDVSFNGEHVAASKNYIVSQKLKTTLGTIQRAHASADKHFNEHLERLSNKRKV